MFNFVLYQYTKIIISDNLESETNIKLDILSIELIVWTLYELGELTNY